MNDIDFTKFKMFERKSGNSIKYLTELLNKQEVAPSIILPNNFKSIFRHATINLNKYITSKVDDKHFRIIRID